jgi:hypothetical protein
MPLIVEEPDIHVQSPVPGSYFHRSFNRPKLPLASYPCPPNSQKFPEVSIQATA